MLTRFVSDNAWGAPDYVYPYDKTVSLKNTKLYVAGNLNASKVPFLTNVKDTSNNNYSQFYLTSKRSLSSLVDIEKVNISKSSEYPGVLALYSEKGLINDDTLFFACVPLYTHVNNFDLFFASFNSNFKDLSGASFLISTVGAKSSAYEIGFSIAGEPAKFNSDNTSVKLAIDAYGNMDTTAKTLTANVQGLNFCSFLSGSVTEFSKQQSVTLTISAKNGTWSANDLAGVALTFGNTYYGDLSGDVINFYRRFCIQFKVVGFNVYRPPGYNINEVYTVPSPIIPGFTNTSTTQDVARALSAMFGAVQVGNDYRPTQLFIDVKNVTFNSNSLSMTLIHKLSGSLVEPYVFFNGYSNQNIDLKIAENQRGIDAGFTLTFGPYIAKPIKFKLPKRFIGYTTVYNPKSISDFKLTQNQNYIQQTFKPDFTTNFYDNNDIILNINFKDDKKLSITHTLYDSTAILVSDDFNKELYFIDKRFTSETVDEAYMFSYLYDEANRQIIIYKSINDVIYGIGSTNGVLEYTRIDSFNNIPENCVFYNYTFGNYNINYNRNVWASYLRTLNPNNLFLNTSRSLDIENNFLFHTEYNNINNNISINFLPLKNQLNEFYEQGRKMNSVNFREYHSLYTGDNAEKGNLYISTGYTTSNKEYILKSGEVTWFHIPYNESFKRIDINEANFVVNGAVCGDSPVFSDRIWKKAGDYRNTTNFGNSKLEQTGQWLCAWLSGGSDASDAVWVDRFYNPEIITEFEAIKFTNNVNYIPSYTGKNYKLGISDRKSNLKLEPGVWYAYSHVGKTDADKVINYIKKDLVQEGIISLNLPREGEYEFAGKYSGYISLEKYKAPLNNFTLSFFGYSEDWNKIMGSQILGNYKDSGFGIFNYLEVNPFTYYFNGDKASIFNIQNDNVLNITLPPSLSGEIVGMFIRNYHENIHYILKDFSVVEYDLNGVLVDYVNVRKEVIDPDFKYIIGANNNNNFGVVLFSDFSYFKINLRTNVFKYYNGYGETETVNFDGEGNIHSVYIGKDDKVYIVRGRSPIIRDDKLYFIDNSNQRLIKVYNLVSKEIQTYIDTSKLEASPVAPKYTFYYENDKAPISEFPYKTFNLNFLSGVGINFFPPDGREYQVGISVFREPYYFYDIGSKQHTTTVPLNPIFVDLNGNHWIIQDKIDPSEGETVYYADRLGFNTHIDYSNLIYIADPYYQEVLASTNLRIGRVFVYNLKNFKLNKLTEINLGPTNQVFNLTYKVSDDITPGTQAFFDTLSTFPISASIIFSNGSEVFSHPYGEGSYNRNVSAISLGFFLSAALPPSLSSLRVNPHHPYSTITNSISAAFLPPLTAISNIVNQLTAIFNRTVVRHPKPVYTNNLHLSSFFNFEITSQTLNSFTLQVKNKFSGPTPLSAWASNLNDLQEIKENNEMLFFGVNESTDLLNSTYEAIKKDPGLLATGKTGQLFGSQVVTNIGSVNEAEDTSVQNLLISSPGWESGSSVIGKVTFYKDVKFVNSTFAPATSYDLFLPGTPLGVDFGTSMKSLNADQAPPNARNIPKYVVINAYSKSQSITPFSSALFYDFRQYEGSSSLENIFKYSVMGPASEQFAYKVGITREFIAVSSTKGGLSGTGAINLYRYEFDAPRDQPFYVSRVEPPAGTNRYRFGHAFDINYDYLAVASLSSQELTGGNITVDLFLNNHANKNYYESTSDIQNDPNAPLRAFPVITEYEFLSTINIIFANKPSAVSSMDIDISIYNNYITVGVWRGDSEVFGDEQGKVCIFEMHKNKPILVYERYYENYSPLIFKTYFGKSVASIRDKLVTGTLFIYNTGNSLVNAVCAISTAINKQTPALKSNVENVDDWNFTLSVVGTASAEDTEPFIVTSMNPDIAKLNIFRLIDYIPGRSLNYSGEILNYAFNVNEETIVMTDFNRFKEYDVLGKYKQTIDLKDKGLSPTLSCIRFGINNVIKNGDVNESYSLLAANGDGEHYKIDYSPSEDKLTNELIDTSNYNNFFFPQLDRNFERVVFYQFDITNCHFMESYIRVENLTPKLYFKLRLNNRLDYEDALVLTPQYATENLNKGWHHFAVMLDSVNGKFMGYVDAEKVFEYKFEPGKYSFSNILKDNLLVGSTPYFNNSEFDNFYKSRKPLFVANNIKMSDLKFYNTVLTKSEVKFLTYSKFKPSDMKFQLDYGSRNYIDTITRVSKHKLPGRKSTYIDIVINDSLITSEKLQKYYETKILADLKDNLPTYVKINKIIWRSSKPGREKIIEGDINIGNTLTNSGGTDATDIQQSIISLERPAVLSPTQPNPTTSSSIAI